MLKNTENKKEYNLAVLAPHSVIYQVLISHLL